MADTDLPVDGKDVQVMIMVDGVLQRVVDQITNFTVNDVYDRTEIKPLGTPDVLIDDTLVGHEGSIELAVSRPVVDDVMDGLHSKQRGRLPSSIQIREQVRYRDGSVRTYMYLDVKLQRTNTNVRAEARKITLNWKTGRARVRV